MKKKENKKPEIKIEVPKDIEEAEKEAEEEARSKELVNHLLVNGNYKLVAESKDEATARSIIKYVTPVLIVICLAVLVIVFNKKNQEQKDATSTTTTAITSYTTTKRTTTSSPEEDKEFEENIIAFEKESSADDYTLSKMQFDKTSLNSYKCSELKRDETIGTSLDLAYEDKGVSINTSGRIIIKGQFQSQKSAIVLISTETNIAKYTLCEDKHLYEIKDTKIEAFDDKEIIEIFYNEKHHIVIIRYEDYKIKIIKNFDLKNLA